MAAWLRWGLGLSIAAMIVVVPYIHYRATYAHAKRLRVVTAGKFYRCGQLTADGLREAIARCGIRTVINLRNEDPDPLLPASYYPAPIARIGRALWMRPDPRLPDSFYSGRPFEHESEVCRQAGARHVFIDFDLPTRERAPFEHAKAIDEFLKILDDPKNYPVLMHCQAGLNRTGEMTAVYRMEYEHWPVADALREVRANGFGDSAATTADDYIYAYVEQYHPRWKKEPVCAKPGTQPAAPGVCLP